MPQDHINCQIHETFQGQRLERWIKKQYKLIPYSVLQKWFRRGLVRIDGRKVKADFSIPGQCTLEMPLYELQDSFAPKPQGNKRTLEILKKSIVFEDDNMLILNKPHGLATQGGSGQTDYLDLYMKDLRPTQDETLRLVHRLDQETSGLIILAKTYQAAKELTQDFKDRRIEKTYFALVVGTPSENMGTIDAPLIKRLLGKGSKMALAEAGEEGLSALTQYRVLKVLDNEITLLELKPQTGRTHQLRVHCAQALGCPILGDGLYGGTTAHPLGKRTRLYLHAGMLTLKNNATFQALPEWYNAALQGDFLLED